MAYVTEDDLRALIPAAEIVKGCDDDGDGQADEGVLDAVIEAAEDEVEGYLAPVAAVPFAAGAVPEYVQHATRVLACFNIYVRRGLAGQANPLDAQANAVRMRLADIASGRARLEAPTAAATALIDEQPFAVPLDDDEAAIEET